MSKDKTILSATQDAHVQNKVRQDGHTSTVEAQVTVIPNNGGLQDYAHEFTGILECKNLGRRKNNAGVTVVEERTDRSNLSMVGPSNYRARLISRQNQWQHLYQLSNGSHIENVGCTSFPESADRNARVEKSEGTGTIIRTKILSKSGFPEFFEKSTLKGKGIFRRGVVMKGFNITLPSTNSSLQHEVKNSELKHENSHLDGINLREWLKVLDHKANKLKCLHMFRCIVELVNHSHAQGVFLHDLRPSSFVVSTTNQVKYFGSFIQDGGQCSNSQLTGKRPLEQGKFLSFGVSTKRQKDVKNTILMAQHSHFPLKSALNLETAITDQLEKNWYASPEELIARYCSAKSNVFSLGVLLFELLGKFESDAILAAAMSNLCERMFPPNFVVDNLKEVGFCLWLLHPEPASRPTAREILESELINEMKNSLPAELSASMYEEDAELELLLEFLTSINEQKQKQAAKLVENIRYLESDIEQVNKRHSPAEPLDKSGFSKISHINEERITKNITQLGSTYFSMRSKVVPSEIDSPIRTDIDLLTARENCYLQQKDDEKTRGDRLGAFFDGFCEYSRYRKFEVCGVVRNGDFTNSSDAICSMSFDRDEDYFAAAGASKKIRIYCVDSVLSDSVDSHYPAVEMFNGSRISCVCWNSYIRNYLASTDYDGVVKVWDATVGQEVCEFKEHVRRAWSADFSQVHPTKLASGSDDYTVKLWSINEKKCLRSIRNKASVCCVQFSGHSTNLVAFGCADYKTYCFDARITKAPWCVLSGHEKSVSFVKFLDCETLVSASTDNTLKLWDLNRTHPTALSPNACTLTLTGHTNQKNFVGLSVSNGYVACGSETNEVYAYHRSVPVPMTSYKFGSIDPISGKETEDDDGEFVSSVCWRGKSNMVVAANSSGCIKVLQMVGV